MNTADVFALARHLFETRGAAAIAGVAQRAACLDDAGDKEQAKFWRRVETMLLEIRGPRQG
jgi:hypothetical protein